MCSGFAQVLSILPTTVSCSLQPTHGLMGHGKCSSPFNLVRMETAVAENRERQHDQSPKRVIAEKNIPVNDDESTVVPEPTSEASPRWHEPEGIQKGVADADKKARTGSTEETVRNTPPAGAWNETSAD
jgi:hypothetical protein